MDKHYLLLFSGPFEHKELFWRLERLGVKSDTIAFSSPTQAEFIAPFDVAYSLDTALIPFSSQTGVRVGALVSYTHEELEDKLLPYALVYFPNMAAHLSDLILREMSFGSYTSYSLFMKRFRDVDPELMQAVGAYLRCGKSGLKAADALYVHRNTFNYRLANFIKATSLDPRDYHNALFLELYFQLKNRS